MPELAHRLTFYRDAVVIDGQQFPWHINGRNIEVENPMGPWRIVNLPLMVEDVTFRDETLYN
ncbi:MAG: hypothetical protein L0K10_01945 [Brevibacterium aurantiacum]|nr:hypothetical protein [Brevibacterium aurantiacum]